MEGVIDNFTNNFDGTDSSDENSDTGNDTEHAKSFKFDFVSGLIL
jgi:hypothetical protein